MQKILNRLPKLTERNWLIMLTLFVGMIFGHISRNLGIIVTFAFLLPLMSYHTVGLLRSRAFCEKRVYKLQLFCVLWCFFSVIVTASSSIQWAVNIWYLLVCWFFVLFIPKDYSTEEQHKELFSIGVGLICLYLPFCIIALCSIFSGKVIHVPFIDRPVGIGTSGSIADRIFILSHPNTVARVTSFCILFSVYGIATRKNKWFRMFLVFSIFINALVLAHSQSRTGFIAFAAAIGAIVFRAFWLRGKNGLSKLLASSVAAALTVVMVLSGLNLIYKTDLKIAQSFITRTAGNNITETENDEDTATDAEERQEIATRAEQEGQFNMFSTGRDDIWKSTLLHLKNNPKYLLTGMGGGDNFETIRGLYKEAAPHINYHNSFLACLADYGIPLLLAMLVFLCMLVRPCLRMLLEQPAGNNRGLFIVPAFVLMLVLMAIPEIGLFVEPNYANVLFYFFCGHVLHYDALRRKN